MFTIDNKNKMRIVKGDTAIFDLTVKDYTFKEGDKVYFSVKDSTYSQDYLIHKIVTKLTGNVAKIVLSSTDTDIEEGMYQYDIQLSLVDGTVDTVVPPSGFEVIGGVTHD
ncbi:MAG: hypothetical protein ACRCX2_04495 [Paraclostridium sp.]